jgi:serine/threonine protein kinase
MTATSKDDFVACLKASKVIAPKQLDEALAGIGSDDPRQIAIELVQGNLLTRWQAKYLVAGHSRLHVGNYRLLERLRRNEFGDRFLAVHEQLDRLVEIQILPKSLNDQHDLREKFLSSASVASQVDHPNLVHVYDIDQEGKRLYLVVEHAKGNLLSSYAPAEFSVLDIARLVDQLLRGLKAAHEKGIVHGLISPHNVIVTEAEEVKIQNLVMASLENPNHAAATQAGDIQAIGNIGRELLNCLEAKNSGRAGLAAIIEKVASAEPVDVSQILDELASWIKHNDTSSRPSVTSGIAIETSLLNPAHPAASDNQSESQIAGSEPADMIANPSFLHRQNPAVVIGIAAVLCLLTLGGVAWVAFSVAHTRTVASKTIVKKPPVTKNSAVAITQDRAGENSSGGLDRSDGLLAQRVRDVSTDPLTVQEIRAELDKIGGDDSAPELNEVSAESSAESPVIKTDGPPAESVPAVGSETVDPSPVSSEVDKQPAPTQPDPAAQPENPDADTPEKDAGKTTVDEKSQSGSSAADFEKPFEDFPRYVDLENISDASPQAIGKIHFPPNILMAVELVSGDAISRSKCLFELERAPNDKQRWFANFRKRKAAPAIRVGEFFKQDDTFYFQWDPAAANDEDHNYLRNCALKLVGNNEKSTFLFLRAPLEIEGLALAQENGIARVETDIQWLPDPDYLKIEVIPMPYQGIPKSFMFPPDRLVEKRQPVIVFFSEQEKDRFFYLQVSADVKKSLKLQSALMFNALDGSNPVVADPKFIENVANQITHLATVTNAAYEQIKVAERPKDMKYDDFEELKKGYKKSAETAQAQKVTLLEYANMLPTLYGKTIPLRVYFELDDMQIELARSSPKE